LEFNSTDTMNILLRKVMHEQCYPMKDCFQLLHFNEQEFRRYEDEELIMEFLEIQTGSVAKLFLVEIEADDSSSTSKRLVPLKTESGEATVIVGYRNFFNAFPVTDSVKRRLNLDKKAFKVSSRICNMNHTMRTIIFFFLRTKLS